MSQRYIIDVCEKIGGFQGEISIPIPVNTAGVVPMHSKVVGTVVGRTRGSCLKNADTAINMYEAELGLVADANVKASKSETLPTTNQGAGDGTK